MNDIGNDNYQPGLEPPKPMRENSGWLSSNMAQLMVFLNGVILTITAFATLNVFISEIVREELIETTSKVQEQIFTQMTQAEKSINALSTIISQVDYGDNKAVQDYVSSEIKSSQYFDSLFLIEGDEVSSLFIQDDTPYDFKDDYLVIQNNIDIFRNVTKNEFLLTPVKQVNNNNSYAMVKKQQRANGNFIFTVAIFDFKNFLKKDPFGENQTIEQVRILDVDQSEALFIQQKTPDKNSDNFAQYTDVEIQSYCR